MFITILCAVITLPGPTNKCFLHFQGLNIKPELHIFWPRLLWIAQLLPWSCWNSHHDSSSGSSLNCFSWSLWWFCHSSAAFTGVQRLPIDAATTNQWIAAPWGGTCTVQLCRTRRLYADILTARSFQELSVLLSSLNYFLALWTVNIFPGSHVFAILGYVDSRAGCSWQ